MKKLFTGALALLLFMGAAQAQTKDSTKRGQHSRHEMMARKMNLSADQQVKMKAIHEARKAEMKALKQQHKQLNQKYADQANQVLTPAQKEQMQKMKAERKQKAKEGRKGFKHGKAGRHGKGMHKGAQMRKDLNLSADQQNRMAELRKEFKGQFDALKSNQSLTAEQKKEQMKELKKSQQEKMKSILTQEQQEKIKSARQAQKPKNKK